MSRRGYHKKKVGRTEVGGKRLLGSNGHDGAVGYGLAQNRREMLNLTNVGGDEQAAGRH